MTPAERLQQPVSRVAHSERIAPMSETCRNCDTELPDDTDILCAQCSFEMVECSEPKS